MRAILPQPELAAAAQWAARQIPAKPTHPVLAGLLLDARDGQLAISGYNYESAGQATLDTNDSTDGTVLVPGRLFADVIAALPDGMVELDSDDNELHVVLGDHDRFNLPLLPDSDYPALPQPPEPNGTVDAGELAAAIADVSGVAMSGSDAVGANTALGSVRITADDGQLTITATDRYRIALRTIEWAPQRDVAGNILIPAPVLTAAAKNLAGAGQVSLAFNEQGRNVGIYTDRLRLVTRTTDTAFPDVHRLLPAEDAATGSIQVDPAELTKALTRASLVTDKTKARNVRLTIRGDHIDIEARGDGPTSRTSVGADIDGLDDGYDIAFSASYLASVIAPIDELARLFVYTPTRPILARPANKDADYRAVLMPVLLKYT